MYKKREIEIEILNGTLSSVIIILREREIGFFSPPPGVRVGAFLFIIIIIAKENALGEKETKK